MPHETDPQVGFTPDGAPANNGSAGTSRLRSMSITSMKLFLNDRSARARRAAVLSLGRLKDKRSIPTLIGKLKDTNQMVRHSAILALGLSGDGKARYTLSHLARDTEEGAEFVGNTAVPSLLRGFSLIILSLTGSPGIGPILQKIALDSSCQVEVRAMAIEGLGLLADDDAIRFLVDFSQIPRQDYRLHSAAATALGKSGNPRAVPVLLKYLSSKKSATRRSAALALGSAASRGDNSVVRHLFRTFSGTNDISLKGFSLVAMGQIGGADALKNLKMVAKRGRSADLSWALLGLGIALRSAPEEKVPEILLSTLKNNRNRSIRGAAAIALGLARDGKAVEELERQLKNGDEPYLRGYCAMALGMIGDSSAIPVLRSALMERNIPQVNTQAAMALCLLNDRDAADEMTDLLLNCYSESSKAMASRSLTYLGGGRVAARLLDFISTRPSDEVTYMYCMELIAKLVMGHRAPLMDRLARGSNYTSEFPIVGDLLDYGI